MSGGSQHNPNGRQSQLGPGWSPLQMANLLARAPQAHMASDRGVTWHTPTPPPHLYHVPAPSSPDPLQAMKNATSNSVFRHTTTPPELYRHTPTPPDKHIIRHTPSPGDVKVSSVPLPPVDLYPHLGPGREKLRPEDLLAYARVGVDLSLSGARASNGAAVAVGGGGGGGGGALSVRDAPTINSLIARTVPVPPRHAPAHAHTRVDALLERLAPAVPSGPPAAISPHSVIVHPRAAPTPSPPSSNEDSADSCGAPPGSKRKRKPERTLRVPLPPPISDLARDIPLPPAPSPPSRLTSPPPRLTGSPVTIAATDEMGTTTIISTAAICLPPPRTPPPLENGDATHEPPCNGPEAEDKPPSHARRKTRSGSSETIDDIAAMIASNESIPTPPPPPLESIALPESDPVDKLESVLASPATEKSTEEHSEPEHTEDKEQPASPAALSPEAGPAAAAAAPRRRSGRLSDAEAANVPVDSPSEARPAEPEPPAASFVEVENQLEMMFAGLEEKPTPASDADGGGVLTSAGPTVRKQRRKSAPARTDRRRARAVENQRRKAPRKKAEMPRARKAKEATAKDAYDSGSNASSSRSRGPYIQIRGARDSPASVSVMNTAAGDDDEGGASGGGAHRRKAAEEFRNGARSARGLHASTLGLRYDATTADRTWLCAFCQRGPHRDGLGDLFGPYDLDTDCDEYRCMEESTRRRYVSEGAGGVWFHEPCGVWAPGLVAAGARLWGLAAAVWAARAQRCACCARPGAAIACAQRACPARLHLPCAKPAGWTLREDDFRALCPRHA